MQQVRCCAAHGFGVGDKVGRRDSRIAGSLSTKRQFRRLQQGDRAGVHCELPAELLVAAQHEERPEARDLRAAAALEHAEDLLPELVGTLFSPRGLRGYTDASSRLRCNPSIGRR